MMEIIIPEKLMGKLLKILDDNSKILRSYEEKLLEDEDGWSLVDQSRVALHRQELHDLKWEIETSAKDA